MLPAIAASDAIARSPATRATALLTAEAMPDRSCGADPRIAAVSGDTVIASSRPSTSIPGSTCHA